MELQDLCCKWAGLDPTTSLEWYEEIKFEPNVMCDSIAAKQSLVQCQLEDGDIIIFQASVPEVMNVFYYKYILKIEAEVQSGNNTPGKALQGTSKARRTAGAHQANQLAKSVF